MKKVKKLVFLPLLLLSSSLLSNPENKINACCTRIADMASPSIEFVLGLNNSSSPDIKQKADKVKTSLSQRLGERFTEKELTTIEENYQRIGASNIPKMARVMMEQIGRQMTNPCQKMETIHLKISSSYDALLEKKFVAQQLETRMRSYYLKTCIKAPANATGKNLAAEKEADDFIKNTKNSIKKVVSDNFTEDQYTTFYTFEQSDLGKKFDGALKESMITAFK